MHIPDGYLGPATFTTCYALAAPFWWRAWRSLRGRMRSMEIPHVALASAFVFVLMMFNVPIPGGTTGHATGAAVVAVALGAWPAVLALSFALLLQALLFADGGITALGANCLNMAVIQTFVSLGVWRLLRPRDAGEGLAGSQQVFWPAFAAGFAGAFVSSIAVALELGVQPLIARAPDGTPLYSPFPLRVTMPAMVISHLFIGAIEGAVTGFLVRALARSPESLGLFAEPGAKPFWRRRATWIAVTLVILAVPIGILLPMATGAGGAWGEWGSDEAAHIAGLDSASSGMKRLENLWNAPLPDYSMGEQEGVVSQSTHYVLAAVLGVVLITVFFVLLGGWQRRRMRKLGIGG